MKIFRKHLSILLAAAMLFGSAQFTFAGGEEPLPEETLIEVASEIAAEESSNSAGGIQLGNLTVSGFNGTLSGSGSEYQIKDGETVEATFTSGAAAKLVISGFTGELTLHTDGTFNGTIDVASDADLVLNGVDIDASGMSAAAVTIEPGVTSTVTLESGSENTLQGGSKCAALAPLWHWNEEDQIATFSNLTIDGSGKLDATGGSESAGIGGCKGGNGVYGNILIKGGQITATGGDGAAGIGSSANPAVGTSSGSWKFVKERWGTIAIDGGSITAKGTGFGAGIGGGNHSDSGKIIIKDGKVNASGHTGIGSGFGSHQTDGLSEPRKKGPGYYYADITIEGGKVIATASAGTTNDGGAGIGGGQYCDSKILIKGGEIKAIGGNAKGLDSFHHGGAGIGGGYEGHAEIEISGGTIEAYGGGAAAGIGSGAIPNMNLDNKGSQGYKCRAGETTVDFSAIVISSGNITAEGGVSGGAGIGGGVGADKIAVTIEGGTVNATGAISSESAMRGGAGIGSGYSGTTSGEKPLYFVTTDDLDVKIANGTVTAVGGWGAAGIGSGADNTIAKSITIDNEKANVVAFADGTKFAIDTRVVDTETGETSSKTEGRSFNGNMVQGTYVHTYEYLDKTQDTTNFENFDVIYQADESKKYSLSKPVGYRSFAVTVEDEGGYYIHTKGEEKIGGGEERFFAVGKLDTFVAGYMPNNVTTKDIQYEAKEDQLCDNFYLFPVKSIIVVKGVQIQPQTDTSLYGKDLDQFETSLREDQAEDFLSNIDHDVYFSIKSKSTGEFVKNDKGEQWIEKVSVENGQPKGRAVFANIDDGTYDVWEVDKDGNGLSALSEHAKFDGYEIALISTVHASDPDNPTNNNGVLDEKTWVDYVTVNNWYRPTVTISGSKTWVDNDNAKNTRPESITIDLWADGKVVDSKTVTATDDWKWTFEGLVKKNQAGNDITYTVKEGKISDYISEVSGYNVKNTYVDPSDPQIRIIAVRTTAEVKGTARMEDIDHSLLFTLQETRPNQQGGTDEPNKPAGTSSKASLRMASGSSGFEPKSLTFTDGVCGEYLIFTDIPEGKDFTAVEVDADGNPVKAGTRYPGGYRLESDPVCKEVEPFAVEGIPEGAAVTYQEVHNVYTASSSSSGGTDPTPTPDPVTPPVDPDPVDPPADPDPTDIPDDPTPQAGPTGGVDDGSDEYGGKDPDSGLEDMEDEDTPKTEYSPLTGDERHTAVWAGVSLASLAAILWLASRRRKEE